MKARIKIIYGKTPFLSDEVEFTDRLVKLIENATTGKLNYLEFNYQKGIYYFPKEVLAKSIIIIQKL